MVWLVARLVMTVIVMTIEEGHDIRILLDRPGFPDIT